MEGAGGTVLFHTQLAAVNRDGDRIHSITVCNKAGLGEVASRVFVDASGDGDLAARAGAPFSQGRERDGATQPMTMNLKLANVDTRAIRKYTAAHPENFLWKNGREEGLCRLRTSPRISLAGYLSEWRQARDERMVTIPRDQVLFFETATPGVVIVNTSRIPGLDPADPADLSRAEIIGRRQCPCYSHRDGHRPGCRNRRGGGTEFPRPPRRPPRRRPGGRGAADPVRGRSLRGIAPALKKRDRSP